VADALWECLADWELVPSPSGKRRRARPPAAAGSFAATSSANWAFHVASVYDRLKPDDWKRERPEPAAQQLHVWGAVLHTADWRPTSTDAPVSTKPVAEVLCSLVRYEGVQAECCVRMNGDEWPRVSFPASVLRIKGIEPGESFIWRMPEDGSVRVADIDSELPAADELSPSEKRELDELERWYDSDKGTPDAWREYTGDGK
jgi:hypothetical protein